MVSGLSIGGAIVTGPVRRIESPREIARFTDGSILVTATTDPDWVPIMKRAAAIVTDHGGRTSHAAIIKPRAGPARSGRDRQRHATPQRRARNHCLLCGGRRGFIYEGRADFETVTIDLEHIPATGTQIMFNLANPAAAFRWWRPPADGVGLLRMEFVVSNHIKVHPMALFTTTL